MLALSLAGCGGGSEPEASPAAEPPVSQTEAPAVESESDTAAPADLEEVTLEWYLAIPGVQKDADEVIAEASRMSKEKINANLNIHFMDFSNYGQQMQLLHSSNTVIDLMYTSNWTNDFYTDVSKGAYQELDFAKIQELAPNVIGGVSEAAWKAAEVDGKLYAIPNTQVQARWPSIMLMKKYVDKYSFDTSTVTEIQDFTPLFKEIADNEAGVYAIVMSRNTDVLGFYISKMGYEYFGAQNPLGVKLGDASLEVVNLYGTEAMRELLDTLREWYQMGAIREDAATVTDTVGEVANGMYASMFGVNNPDTLVNQARLWSVTLEELVMVPLSDPFLSTGSIVATMSAVGQNSKNAERVYMLYNMLYDEQDNSLIDLLSFGIEGKHYNRVAPDLIDVIPDSGYYVDCGWAYGNLFNNSRTDPTQPDWRPLGPQINDTAIISDMLGFSMNPEPIKSELAQISSVMDEFVPSLMTGSVDVEEYLAQLNDKLEKAGMETVRAEIQSQLDAWKG